MQLNISGEGLESLPSNLNHNLKELDCCGNEISSLQRLSRVTALTKLDAWMNPLTSLVGIERLRLLTDLNVSMGCISSLEPIFSLTSLTVVNIRNNGIPSLIPLSSLRSLVSLDLADNEVSDLQPLSRLNNLSYLDCSSNWISSLTPLSALTNLQEFFCTDNYVTSLQPLSSLPRLELIGCYHNPLTSLVPLASIASLQGVEYFPDQQRLIDALLKQRPDIRPEKRFDPPLRERQVAEAPAHPPAAAAAPIRRASDVNEERDGDRKKQKKDVSSQSASTLDYAPLLRVLSSVGLMQLQDLFVREMITLEVARRMTETEMEKVGLPFGARRILHSAFAATSLPPPPSSSVPATAGASSYAPLLSLLSSLGLGEYNDLFIRECIDLDEARHLTDAQLKELGLPLGVRNKLLRAFASSSAALSSPSPAPASLPPYVPAAARKGQAEKIKREDGDGGGEAPPDPFL